MNLISVTLAKSIWLFDTTELNPNGLDLLPVAEALNDRYKFQKYPTPEEVQLAAPNGLQFSGGTFRIDDGQWILVALAVYSDGLVAETRCNTNQTDAFVSDVLMFASRQFRLRFEPSMVREKTYLSQVIVSSDKVLRTVDPKLAAFSAYLSTMLKFSAQIQTTGVHFGPDPSAVGGKSFALRLERKANTPFDKNLYFSEAPLSTDQHLEALKAFEEMVG
jgi:hypothetical protein